ncbi:MAG: LacI family DNA-binding transcriptional regulator [Rectinema sp.]
MSFVYNSSAMSKITIKDIALRAGVSKTTVSFALNYPDRISKETYKRIMAIVEELGYVPNPFARTLTTKRLGAIGLLLPQKIGDIFGNPHLAQVISGIGEECEQKEFSLAILPLIRGKIIEAARKSYVDGLLTIGVGPDHEVVSLLRKNHIPFVTIDGEESASTINIGIDHKSAAREIMRHVLEQGFRQIAILSLEPDTKPSESGHFSIVVQKRLEGFQWALEESGLSLDDSRVYMQNCKGSIDGGYESARYLLSHERRPTAIVAMSDIAAIGALLAAKELGLRVPEDVAVAGFDDIPESVISAPTLTTIHQPAREKGIEAARMVMHMLDGAAGSHIRLPYELVVRESTRRT